MWLGEYQRQESKKRGKTQFHHKTKELIFCRDTIPKTCMSATGTKHYISLGKEYVEEGACYECVRQSKTETISRKHKKSEQINKCKHELIQAYERKFLTEHYLLTHLQYDLCLNMATSFNQFRNSSMRKKIEKTFQSI